ncbi:ligase-associated DNA damage response endonuclease PdeM [Amaricoccus tamworthensis]|uniref:ligase-associated DNA damage response endonuclease PdeM n=1 Tax=Amaricoccus tamworthensis TaxID=57002 RepID=UPI003C7E1BA6
MSHWPLLFHNANLSLNPTGSLWWEGESLLCVADLHLGKSERMARRGGSLLPPYETSETLDRLSREIDALEPRNVVCLGDSFDDLESAGALGEANTERLLAMMAGRNWIWITGNHDPGPVTLPGTHCAEHHLNGLVFRHIAEPDGVGEISGHYHPKARLRLRGVGISRPCFLVDGSRLILPAFGAFTGGLCTTDAAFADVMGNDALAVLTGTKTAAIPMPRPPRRARNQEMSKTRNFPLKTSGRPRKPLL